MADDMAAHPSSALDDRLEHYLLVLDQYMLARGILSTEFSSGFLCLAQANFAAANHTRYGQDQYDDRMQATLKVNVAPNHSKVQDAFDCSAVLPAVEDERGSSVDWLGKSSTRASPPELPLQDRPCNTTPTAAEAYRLRFTALVSNKTDQNLEKEAKLHLHDPIRQFGILVPQQLRAAQAAFARGVKAQLLHMAAAASEMRAIEKEIGELREANMKREREKQC